MRNWENIIALTLGGIMVAAVGVVFFATHGKILFAAPAVVSETNPNGLTIPTVDEMCKAMGAVEGDALKNCQNDENAAGEFVVAWMGYNGFIANGAIDLDQINLMASLGSDPLGITDPSLAGGDPSLDPTLDPTLDPILGGGPGLGSAGGGVGQFQSPAEIALFCLGSSMDWVYMQQCISENDASSHIESALGDSGDIDPSLLGAP